MRVRFSHGPPILDVKKRVMDIREKYITKMMSKLPSDATHEGREQYLNILKNMDIARLYEYATFSPQWSYRGEDGCL